MPDKVYKFVIDPERITLDELIELEEAGTNVSLKMARDLLSKHIVNGTGEYLEGAAALKAVGGLNLLELQNAVQQFIVAAEQLGIQFTPEARGSS